MHIAAVAAAAAAALPVSSYSRPLPLCPRCRRTCLCPAWLACGHAISVHLPHRPSLLCQSCNIRDSRSIPGPDNTQTSAFPLLLFDPLSRLHFSSFLPPKPSLTLRSLPRPYYVQCNFFTSLELSPSLPHAVPGDLRASDLSSVASIGPNIEPHSRRHVSVSASFLSRDLH